ncbi:MAG: DUF504 domain-containing protein [Thermoplasmata archaeon]|nr:DUF504 domain-containing protein [Thermoplasmata archaeon]
MPGSEYDEKAPSRKNVRDVLLELWWRDGRDFSLVEIIHIHRGAPGDVKRITGSDVEHLGKSFITLRDGGMLPYHRVVEVRYGEDVIFIRTPLS